MRGKVPFIFIFLIVLVYVLISIDPPEILFAIFVLYGLSGPVTALWGKMQNRRKKRALVKEHAKTP